MCWVSASRKLMSRAYVFILLVHVSKSVFVSIPEWPIQVEVDKIKDILVKLGIDPTDMKQFPLT